MRMPVKSGVTPSQVLIVVLVCWWAFAFRFARPDFVNDDFDHLSKARQVLFGEVPDRDFYDDGRPLTIYASAVAQWLSPTLLSELTLRAGAIAIGVTFVYVLARGLSQSTPLGLLAALLTMAIRPRLYNYPKILLFPFAIWLLWRYVDRPSRRGVIQLAVATVAAFLFRYDYGVYIGVVYTLTLIAVHRLRFLPPLTLYVALGVVCVAPYLGWLGIQGRLLSTGSGGLTSMRTSMPGLTRAPVHLDWSRGLFYIGPAPPQIAIRWRDGLDAETTRALEERYGLHERQRKSDDRTIRYFMDDPSPSRVSLLVSDASVEDTSGIDRGTGHLLAPSTWGRWQNAIPLLRLSAFHTREDAQGWIYYVFVFSVPLALVLLWLFPDTPVQHAAPHIAVKVLSLALLCAMIHQFLIQGALDSRLPDVAGPTAVLLAWLVRRILNAGERLAGVRSWVVRVIVGVFLAALAVMTWLGVSLYANRSLGSVLKAGVVSPAALSDVRHQLGGRPLDAMTSETSGGIPGLSRYIARCLAPDDRPLIVSYAPEVYYVSGHLFPGGINKFDPGGFNPTSQEILKRLRRQSVPVVVVDEGSRVAFENGWPDLQQYVASRYREVQVLGFGDNRRAFHVLVDPQRQAAGTDPRWGLPCYR